MCARPDGRATISSTGSSECEVQGAVALGGKGAIFNVRDVTPERLVAMKEMCHGSSPADLRCFVAVAG